MPESNDPASAGVISAQAPVTETASAVTAEPTQTETQTASNASIMEKLGVPAEVQEELKSKQPKPDPVTEPETEPVAETDTDIQSAEPEPETNPEIAPTEWPEHVKKVFDKRIAKMRKQKGTAEERAERAEEIAAQLQAQLESTQPVTVAPHSGDLLADVQNEQQLGARVGEAKVVRDWCRKHMVNGFTENEGRENERFISPEEITEKLGMAEDLIAEYAPRKNAELQSRRQHDGLARQVYPALFDRSTEDYQVGNGLLQQLPGLVNHPGRNLILGDYLRGVRARLAESKPNGAVNRDVPRELLRPQPPIAPAVPAAPARANGSDASRKKADQAMNNLAQDGSTESLVAALRAKRLANAQTSNSRSPVLV